MSEIQVRICDVERPPALAYRGRERGTTGAVRLEIPEYNPYRPIIEAAVNLVEDTLMAEDDNPEILTIARLCSVVEVIGGESASNALFQAWYEVHGMARRVA